MTKEKEIQTCLNCKLQYCRGTEACPLLRLVTPAKTVNVSILIDLLRAGYDPAEICFSLVDRNLPDKRVRKKKAAHGAGTSKSGKTSRNG